MRTGFVGIPLQNISKAEMVKDEKLKLEDFGRIPSDRDVTLLVIVLNLSPVSLKSLQHFSFKS